MEHSLVSLSSILGTIRKGRNGKTVEILTPKNRDEAHRNSLSDQFGQLPFPFHIDMAHRQIPSRYLVFACSSADGEVAPTYLLHIRDLDLASDERIALETGVFLVKNGRNSFFSNIKQPHSPFLRWDPGCMHPKDPNAILAAKALSNQATHLSVQTINWSTGALLIVDNWNMLHARGQVMADHGERSILRTTIQ